MELYTVFGFDMGTNSIGWCIQTVGSDGLTKKVLGMGSRIFDNSRDPKTHVPLSVTKRIVHSASVRRDRQIMRTKNLCKLLRKYGLLPSDEKERVSNRNPYKLRAQAVHKQIDLFGIGRAILHINKRRGFKSNAKIEQHSDDSDLGGMKAGISRLQEMLGNKTLGEFLYERKKEGLPTRMRANVIKSKNEYEFYADRKMYETELCKIWETQQKYHKNLTKEMLEKISSAIFSQRPLKVPERGFCQFESGERRAYKAYPIFQKVRILQEINALEIIDISDNSANKLTKADREKIANALMESSPKLLIKSILRHSRKSKNFWEYRNILNSISRMKTAMDFMPT